MYAAKHQDALTRTASEFVVFKTGVKKEHAREVLTEVGENPKEAVSVIRHAEKDVKKDAEEKKVCNLERNRNSSESIQFFIFSFLL